MLLKYYEKKVDIFISSIDITSDLKLFYNALRLCGRLEHQYSSWKSFEMKFKLPNAKEVSAKNVSLEEYFLKREILIDYCKDFRLRRFRHQQEDSLPLVDVTRYKNNLDSWRTEYNSKTDTSTKSSESVQEIFNISAERNTEELFEHYIQLKQEKALSEEIVDVTNITKRLEDNSCVEVLDTPVIMSPLLFVSESDDESEGEAQCTDSIIEVINVEDSDEKLQTVAEVKENKNETITSSNRSDLDRITQTKRNLRKSDKPKKIILNDSNKIVTRNNDNISGKVLRNHRIHVVEESKAKRNKTKEKDSNQGKTQTKKDDDISKNLKRIKIKIVNNPKTRSTIIATPGKKNNISRNVDKSDDFPNPSPKRDLKDSQNAVNERIKLSTKDNSNNLQRSYKKNEKDPEKVPIKQEKYTKEIIDKGINLSKNSDEAPKRRSNMLRTKENTEIQFPHTGRISKGFNLRNNAVKKGKKASTSNEKTAKETVNCAKNAKNGITERKAKVNKENTLSNRQIKKNLSKEILSTTKQEAKSPQKSSNNKKTTEKEVATVKNNYSKNKSNDLISVTNTSDKHITPKTPILKSAAPRKVPKTASSFEQHELAIAPVGLRTRGMKRTTRSSGGNIKSKYMMISDWSLDIDKKLGLRTKKVRKKSVNKVVTEIIEPMSDKKDSSGKIEENNKSSSRSVQSITQSNNIVKTSLKSNPANKSSQTSFLPMSDYEDIQCGQKLTPNSNASFEQQPQIFQKSYDFLVPSTPPSLRNLEYPSFPLTSINIPDSELAIVPSTSANADVILLSSSQDEGSISSASSLSRRTRVLKRREVRNQPVTQNKSMGKKLKATFGELLFQQNLRKATKSPDIFSNCSDVGLTCSQVNNKTFEGFKIFGSEVKQYQQQYARSATVSTGPYSKDRSCLDLLEKMFEPRQKKATPKKTVHKITRQNKRADIVPALPVESTTTKSTQLATEGINSKTLNNKPNPIEEDVVFEITNNGTFGSMIRINSNGDASPVQQQQQLLKSTQHNKITNYLIGSTQQAAVISAPGENDLLLQRTPRKNTQLSGTANGINGSGSGNVTSVQRKSPKSKQTTQNTKLTKWFSKNSSGKPPANESTNEMQDSNSTRKSPIKRRRLELSFNN